MVKPALKTRSVGTRVTDDEYARLETLAGDQTVSEWVRAVLLRQAAPSTASPAEEILLAELLALRTILLNLLFRIVAGEKITAQEMRQLIERADQDKSEKANRHLQGKPRPVQKAVA